MCSIKCICLLFRIFSWILSIFYIFWFSNCISNFNITRINVLKYSRRYFVSSTYGKINLIVFLRNYYYKTLIYNNYIKCEIYIVILFWVYSLIVQKHKVLSNSCKYRLNHMIDFFNDTFKKALPVLATVKTYKYWTRITGRIWLCVGSNTSLKFRVYMPIIHACYYCSLHYLFYYFE